jgi:hypothetical protein
MRELVKRKVRYLAVLSLIAIFSIAPGSTSLAAPRTDPERDHAGDRQKVLAVVASRTHNGKVLEKFKDKLEVLNDRKLQLVVSLCERIVRDDDAAGADIAFSLVTALVVLS